MNLRLRTVALLLIVAGGLVLIVRDAPQARPIAEHENKVATNSELPQAGWALLQTLDLKSGTVSPELNRLSEKVVRIPGFMIPLEDDSEQVSDFLLVPYAGACIHVPAPPANQIVRVRMAAERKVGVAFEYPVWVTGKLTIQSGTGPYGEFSFQLAGTSVAPYKE